MNKSINNKGVSIICEIASAHGGDVEILKKMLSEADSVGADWTKVQVYNFESLVAEENEKFSELKTIELKIDEWIDVIRFAEKLKTKLIVEVFDIASLHLVSEEPAVQAFKIPTADLGDRGFIEEVCKLGKPVFIGVGGASIDEIDEIYEQISTYKGLELVMLHGIQNFPTQLKDSLLSKIRLLKLRYGCEIGFADHIDAEDAELARALPAMAIAAGATVIEKHLTLDRSKKGFDYYSALNPDEFSGFVKFTRQVFGAMGPYNSLDLTSAEMTYRNKMKKFAVLDHDVEEGSSVYDTTVKYRRTSSSGITRKEFTKFKNKLFVSSFKKNTILTRDCFN
jgi:N,N'-diacetyllegionaminate synthase